VATFEEINVEIKEFSNENINSKLIINNPKLWDINTPNRYIAQTILEVDGKIVETYNTPFGIRTIEFTANRGFLLNGRRVQIQGTCNHHDLGALGAAMNTSALKRQLIILKEMGCNSLRTSHNPPTPELLELADMMGFLVWDEAFDCWQKGKRTWDYNKLYDEWHEKDLIAMVKRDRNHPSVFIWSIGNEVYNQHDGEMTRHLAEIVRNWDPTRPVSNGYNDPDRSREKGAPLSLDLMGINYFFDQQPKWELDPQYKNMPAIGSETSSCVSTRGEYYFGKPYQNFQVSSYDLQHPDWGCTPDYQFKVNSKLPNLLGEYVWTGFDYLGEPIPYWSDEYNLVELRNDPTKKEEVKIEMEKITKKSPPSRSSYFGIVDLAGFPKDRFYLYQSQWRPELPLAHILPHWNWPERIDSIVPVHVYTSGDAAELFLNGKSLGKKTITKGENFRLIWDSVKYQPGTLKVVTYKKGVKWASDEVKTTGLAASLQLNADKKSLQNDGEELLFITVKVLDKNGLLVPRSNPLIEFEVSENGEIVATDNGDPISYVPFQSHKREAFNGLALLIVKAKKGANGNIVIKAKNSELKMGEILIPLKNQP
jgi:beta-galactosidase